MKRSTSAAICSPSEKHKDNQTRRTGHLSQSTTWITPEKDSSFTSEQTTAGSLKTYIDDTTSVTSSVESYPPPGRAASSPECRTCKDSSPNMSANAIKAEIGMNRTSPSIVTTKRVVRNSNRVTKVKRKCNTPATSPVLRRSNNQAAEKELGTESVKTPAMQLEGDPVKEPAMHVQQLTVYVVCADYSLLFTVH